MAKTEVALEINQAADRATAVCLHEVSKRYGDFVAVDKVSLDVREGEFLTLLGPSGSGKTTTLKMIAGFETPSAGEIDINGKSTRGVPPHRRNVGMVFQSYSLFPHMTVFENVAFPLKIRRRKSMLVKKRVTDILNVVNLDKFSHRKPRELSGGQRQRVALARALVYEPELLLMDEPLSALDKKLREQLQSELRRIHRSLGVTILFVTHDQEEALRLSDRIAVFDTGRIIQCAAGEELYHHPADEFVASFLGNGNVFGGEVANVDANMIGVRLKCGSMVFTNKTGGEQLSRGDQAKVFVRPEQLKITTSDKIPSTLKDNRVSGTITERIFGGGSVYIRVLANGGEEIEINAGASSAFDTAGEFAIGRPVDIFWSPAETHIFKGLPTL